MDTAYKEKTRRATARFGFSGVESGKKNLLSARLSNNFFCKQGSLQTMCISGMKHTSGTTQYCSELNPISLRYAKIYDLETKTYTNKMFALSATGIAYKEGTTENKYVTVQSGLGRAELISFKGSDLISWIVACGTKAGVVLSGVDGADFIPVENLNGAACFFEERLFLAQKPSTLVYSAMGEWRDFTDTFDRGGAISFPMGGGELVAIKIFKGKMYLFFDYGVMRLEPSGDMRKSKAKKIEYDGGKILSRTVCIGKDAVFFFAQDGLYRLDENGVKRLHLPTVLLPYADSGNEGCAPWNNMALIRYQVGANVYKTLAVCEDGKDCFYLDDMVAISKDEGGMVLFKEKTGAIYIPSEDGIVFNGYAEFSTQETDLGVAQKKILTKLRFRGEGKFYLTVYNGARKTQRLVELINGAAEVRLFERGECFRFMFEAETPMRLDEMTAEMKIPV